MNIPKKYIFDGGPGWDKITILNLTQQEGYEVLSEAARGILRDKSCQVGTSLQEAIIRGQSVLESRVNDENVFLDRGLPSCEAYVRYFGEFLEETTHETKLQNARDDSIVSLLDSLSNRLYKNDAERREVHEEVEKISRHLQEIYQERGFKIIKIPFDTLSKRMKQVVNLVREKNEWFPLEIPLIVLKGGVE